MCAAAPSKRKQLLRNGTVAPDKDTIHTRFSAYPINCIFMHGSAIEDAYLLRRILPIEIRENFTNQETRAHDVIGRRRHIRSDGPYRFIGDDETRKMCAWYAGKRDAHLLRNFFDATAGSFLRGLSDTQNAMDSRGKSGLDFPVYQLIGLPAMCSALTVTDDRVVTIKRIQHGERNFSRIGTVLRPPHILRAALYLPRKIFCKVFQMNEWRAHDDIRMPLLFLPCQCAHLRNIRGTLPRGAHIHLQISDYNFLVHR